jgi:Ca2+-binding RTX toxin-like protein
VPMRQTLALALLALILLPAAASASTATTEVTTSQGKGCTVSPESCVRVEFHYTAGDGETNDVQITRDGGFLIVRDTGATIVASGGCKSEGPNQARCSPPEGPSTGFIDNEIALGDMPDRYENAASWTTLVAGGAGDDRLIGGTSFDMLIAGPGSDHLEGRGGIDYLDEGLGGSGIEPDVMDGGEGRDRVSYAARTNRVVVDLAGGPSGEVDEGDTLISVEEAHGGRGSDLLQAGSSSVILSGRGGNDRLIGGQGGDRLFGDSGHDKLYGVFGRDRLEGGTGNDRLEGGCDADKLVAGAGRDRLFTADGTADRLYGGADNDFAEYDQRDSLSQIERRRRLRVDACAL